MTIPRSSIALRTARPFDDSSRSFLACPRGARPSHVVIRIGARATEGEELFGILVRGALTPHVHGTDARAFTVGGGTGLHVGSPHGVCRKAEKEFPLLHSVGGGLGGRWFWVQDHQNRGSFHGVVQPGCSGRHGGRPRRAGGIRQVGIFPRI